MNHELVRKTQGQLGQTWVSIHGQVINGDAGHPIVIVIISLIIINWGMALVRLAL